MAGTAYIGTSGWTYKHWADGIFYPPDVPSRAWLEFYAERFPTVELNASFYRLPQEKTFAGWKRRTPRGFLFAVKASRIITHIKRLRGARDALDLLLERAALLGAKLGPVLFQLPPSLRRDDAVLRDFLAALRAHARGRRLRAAFEFRHPSWLDDAVFEGLEKARVSLVLADYGRVAPREPATARYVYVRRHGPGSRYNRPYSRADLERDADMIEPWLREGRDVYAYFNNDVGGHAIRNARELAEILRRRGLAVAADPAPIS